MSNNQTHPSESSSIRLNKFISNAGVCSRRDADVLIAEGKIKVNGRVVTELGIKVSLNDTVVYKRKVLKKENFQYLLLNKPSGFITTMDDPKERKTVMSLIKKACKERIYPVGRLDKDTTGLLLFTNDGETAKRLTHPSHKVKKIYQLGLDKPLTNDHFDQLLSGVMLEDGLACANEVAILDNSSKNLGIEIHIGKNRILRRMFEFLGYRIEKLDRVMFGTLTKKRLSRGKYRFLSPKEIMSIQRTS